MKDVAFRYKYLLLGVFFLCVPSFHSIDLLPDAVGLFLIAAACRPLAAGIAAFDEAETAFTKAAYVTLLRIPAALLVLSLWAGADNGVLDPLDARERTRAIVAVLTLGLAILETIFLLSAFSKLFAALDHLGEREGFLSAARMKNGQSTSLLFKIAYVFLVGRAVCEVMPSFLAMCAEEPPSTSFYALLTVGFAALSALGGGILFSFWREQLSLLKEDEECNAYFTKTVTDNLAKTEKRVAAHRFSLSMALGTAAAVFALDLIFDAVPILPDFVSGLCFLFVLFTLKDGTQRYRHALYAGITYTALSFVSYVLNFAYLRIFESYNAVNMIDAAYTLFTVYAVVAILEAIALAAFLFCLFRFFSALLPSVRPTGYISKAGELALRRLSASLVGFFVTGLVTVALSLPQLFLQTEYVLVPANTEKLGTSSVALQAFPYMGLICTVVGILFILSAYIFFSGLKSAIEKRAIN